MTVASGLLLCDIAGMEPCLHNSEFKRTRTDMTTMKSTEAPEKAPRKARRVASLPMQEFAVIKPREINEKVTSANVTSNERSYERQIAKAKVAPSQHSQLCGHMNDTMQGMDATEVSFGATHAIQSTQTEEKQTLIKTCPAPSSLHSHA